MNMTCAELREYFRMNCESAGYITDFVLENMAKEHFDAGVWLHETKGMNIYDVYNMNALMIHYENVRDLYYWNPLESITVCIDEYEVDDQFHPVHLFEYFPVYAARLKREYQERPCALRSD